MADSATCVTKRLQADAKLWIPAFQQQALDSIATVDLQT